MPFLLANGFHLIRLYTSIVPIFSCSEVLFAICIAGACFFGPVTALSLPKDYQCLPTSPSGGH